MQKELIILGCSATKIETDGLMPAVSLYDGPSFRVLRSFLRKNAWPEPLSIAVLSAKYGLFGGLAHIPHYNQQMTAERALELNPTVTASLQKLAMNHHYVDLVMGRHYLDSIDLAAAEPSGAQFRFVEGAIGMKLKRLHHLLSSMPHTARVERRQLTSARKPLYFLPDWDDFVDVDYDFSGDRFSSPNRSARHEEHSIALMRPERVSDGVLVSLAQHLGSKGLLKRVDRTTAASLAPQSVRRHFKLLETQWAFGDCGAFSYVNCEKPTISVEQAVSVYDLYDFDFGASVDHIPVPEIERDGKKIRLTLAERKSRKRLTRANAAAFISTHRSTGSRFTPVGVIQGLDIDDYAPQLGDYLDMGYTHLAIGGLVPRGDAEVKAIVQSIYSRIDKLGTRPWIHLLGVYRPSLQGAFRQLGVDSFDSATYFRKAWLRSDQNYLGVDGNWYAAIRVPPTSDARTMIRLRGSGLSEKRIKRLEERALAALHSYDSGSTSLSACLKAVQAYDALLVRAEDQDVTERYRRTLQAKPWKTCSCAVCSSIGIDALIFRGLNRNKRRGAHNTLRLYGRLNNPNLGD